MISFLGAAPSPRRGSGPHCLLPGFRFSVIRDWPSLLFSSVGLACAALGSRAPPLFGGKQKVLAALPPSIAVAFRCCCFWFCFCCRYNYYGYATRVNGMFAIWTLADDRIVRYFSRTSCIVRVLFSIYDMNLLCESPRLCSSVLQLVVDADVSSLNPKLSSLNSLIRSQSRLHWTLKVWRIQLSFNFHFGFPVI